MKKGRHNRVWIYILAVVVILVVFITIQFNVENNLAYERLKNFNVQNIETDFGSMSFVDEGTGEPVLLVHGIFGGYDQGFTSLKGLVGENYRKIAPSRFGYPGSDLPDEPTPFNQAKAFQDLLDQLDIEKTYIISTSAGGASGIAFALEYPERTKGLILLSSGVPIAKMTRDELNGVTGPPALLINDFPMWISTKYFGFVFKTMFNSEVDNEMLNTMLPVKPRKSGINADSNITNLYMDLNYEEYNIEEISVPMLIVHAKDDPFVKYEWIEKFISRTNAKTAVFETGGHLITGHENEVSFEVKKFIEDNK